MPPKPKFTREQVIEKALLVVRTEGEDALTARCLAEELGTSPRPIFTLFSGMDELKEALVEPAHQVFIDFYHGYREYTPAFKRFGVMQVDFAEKEPHLFAFLFMGKRGTPRTLAEWSNSLIGDAAIATLKESTGFDDEVAHRLFEEIWLDTFSICVLKVTGAAVLTETEVSDHLTRIFLGLYSLAKAGLLTEKMVQPVGPDGTAIALPDIPIAIPGAPQ